MKFTEYQKEKRFDPAAFENPSAFASPVYSWVWNSPISEELIMEQLDEMQEEGIRAFYIIPEPKEFRPATMRTTMEPEYLKDEFLIEAPAALEFMSASKKLDIVYEDENLLLLNKKVGLLVHPDDKEYRDTLIFRVQRYLYEKGEYDPEKENCFTPETV